MEYGFKKELYPTQKRLITETIHNVNNGKPIVISSPTGTGKTLSLLCVALNFIRKPNLDEDIFALLSASKTIVYYCSRTHSQLAQVMAELKTNTYRYNSLIMGSRRVYCLHPQISRSPSLETLNVRCRDAIKDERCEYYGNPYFTVGPTDIEDLSAMGREHKFCPYYYSRERSHECEIVLLPYQLLFTNQERNSLEINLEDKIVIIDEAHNICKTVIELNSAQVSWNDLRSMSKLNNLPEILREILAKLLCFSRSITKESVSDVVPFLCALKLEKINMLEVDDTIYEKKLAQRNEMPVIFEVSRLLRLLTHSDKHGRVFYSREYLRFTPLDARLYFQSLKKCKSVIFAGGTMEPVDSLRGIFPGLEYTCYPSVASDFLPMIITETVHKKVINLSYEERDKHIDGILDTLIALSCTAAQGGILIFVPSRYFLEAFKNSKKVKYFRRQVVFEDEIKINEFYASPSILFAVLGGKLSEGINFADEACRLIIIVGVPYPTRSLEIAERQRHSPGYQVNEAMQRVNQALGRAVRHSKDYAAMVLLDSRYTMLKKHISPWIAKNIKIELLSAAILKIHRYLKCHS